MILFAAGLHCGPCLADEAPPRKTAVAIGGDQFLINGKPTYFGRVWQGKRIEGLLFNSRMVQAIFDDLNPKTRDLWAYPDTGKWDAERNTREFIAAMPEWRRHGLLGITLNLQGGNPKGYGADQPWHNSVLTEEGKLRPDYLARLEGVLDRADDLGMVVILGIFYFGQDERLKDEAAVVAGLDNTIDWLFDKGYRHVLIEINNECNVRYDHAILKPARVHELIERVKQRKRDGCRFLVSTSYGGGTIPGENVVRAADYLLLHGNGVGQPERIADMVKKTRQVAGYRPMPIVLNEDDHFAFDQPKNNLLAATGEYASWGFFDYRMKGEGFDEGYQSVPVNWGGTSARKRDFFAKVQELTGATTWPAKEWTRKTPAEAGLDADKLSAFSNFVGGRGCVVRHGYLVHEWGDAGKRGDIASASKPIFSYFLLLALQLGLIGSLDEPIARWEPRLKDLNPDLEFKDRAITWRHLANQTSCYGVVEKPGAAFCYSDFNLALLWDTLFLKVYKADYKNVDEKVLRPRLTDLLQCQDQPTLMAFGTSNRPGRIAISPRDFARFGQLFLRQGEWNGKQLLDKKHVALVIGNPLPAALPRASKKAAAMIAGQRTYGSQVVPDNQTDHFGSYSWLWWVNGKDATEMRMWPDAPNDTFGAFGHGGVRALWVIPSLDIVVSYNDAKLEGWTNGEGSPTNQAIKKLLTAVTR
jgi:CubicO group peptidase (beta-lactamase class C family)